MIVRTGDDAHRAKCLIRRARWINGRILLTAMLNSHAVVMFFRMLTYPRVEYVVGRIRWNRL